MNHQTFTWGRSRYRLYSQEQWLDVLIPVGLFLAALVLLTANLGSLPLRDWDEATVAQVAKEIWQAPPSSLRWLFPTLWGEPYLNKPPLVHNLIALAYSLGGVNEFTARFPGAFLTALSVPLLYLLGREIFPARLNSLFSALVYLTLLPVMRHGRLAMLDGAVLCFEILMITCILRSRRDLRWALGAGLGFSLICLTKGILGLLLGGISLVFLFWDTPRLLSNVYFWFGWVLGMMPMVGWYGAQWIHYQGIFTDSILAQQLNRVGESLDNHQGPIWYYLLEILKYSLPWLLFSVYGFYLAWQERTYSWAKLVLIWGGVYLVVVSLMSTKLPWYIMPFYPAFALGAGAALAQVANWPSSRSYPRIWTITLGFLAFALALAAIVPLVLSDLDYAFSLTVANSSLLLVLAALVLTLAAGAILLAQGSKEFIPILYWGMYISLILFFHSPYWNWELNETYPVKPVAQMIRQQNIPPEQQIYTSRDNDRPSLNFYSQRRLLPIDLQDDESESQAITRHWEQSLSPYLLLKRKTVFELDLQPSQIVDNQETDWVLVSKPNYGL